MVATANFWPARSDEAVTDRSTGDLPRRGADSIDSADADGHPRPRRRRRAVLWVATLVIMLLVATGLGFWIVLAPKPALPATQAWVAAGSRVAAKTVAATGSVRLKTGSTVRIGSQLSGIVQQLNVTVGAHVNRGDVIAEIDARPVRAKVEQAKAQVARNEALALKAGADARRANILFADGGISAQQLDDAKSAAAVADASLEASRRDLAAAAIDLNYVAIRAPISGVVASVATQRGETVAAAFATPTFVTIIQPSALEVVAFVDEADIGDVRPGETAEFTVEAWPDRSFAGTVERIAPVATVVSGVINYEVAIRIDGDVSALKPDMTANVTLTTARRTIVTVPAGAVRRTPSGSVVTVRDAQGRPSVRQVRVDQTRDGLTDLSRGVAVGEPVLVETGGRK